MAAKNDWMDGRRCFFSAVAEHGAEEYMHIHKIMPCIIINITEVWWDHLAANKIVHTEIFYG
jgi:hypothetical protein